jgi:hypothetical protein
MCRRELDRLESENNRNQLIVAEYKQVNHFNYITTAWKSVGFAVYTFLRALRIINYVTMCRFVRI